MKSLTAMDIFNEVQKEEQTRTKLLDELFTELEVLDFHTRLLTQSQGGPHEA